ncbi:MAG: HAD family phosphatase [Candidatus Pacebacteria bacterium]|nr:HAD family phosphatase [Candidatus Paceibacterota bacterium]
MNKENIKGIIFDLDGVLLETEYYQWQGWVIPLRELGIELTKEKYYDYAGKNGKQIEKELIRDFNLNLNEGELLSKKEPLLIKWFEEKKLNYMPFAKEAVEFFSSNFKTAICSGGPKDEIILKLKNAELIEYFPIIVAGSDVEKSKPAPDIYLKAQELIGLSKEECLAIEDTQYGLEAAKGAGLNCVSIPNEYSLKQDFSKADMICNSLKDLIEYFNGN